jgi:fructokinase
LPQRFIHGAYLFIILNKYSPIIQAGLALSSEIGPFSELIVTAAVRPKEAEARLTSCATILARLLGNFAMKRHIVVGLGELLWDLFPAGKQLGGAPANFAYISSLLGERGIPASRVGEDDLGAEAVRRLGALGLSTEYIQRDAEHPTGTVQVEVDADGQPRFEITEFVAWDFLAWTHRWQELADQADAVCFSTLAQRSEHSRSAMRSFLLAMRPDAVRVCDINLRQNFFNTEVVMESMKLSTIVKLNHDELPRVMQLFDLEHRNEEESARKLLLSYDLQLICVTRGNHGSLLISCDERAEHSGFKVRVADTVGAGDAFTAALVHGHLQKESLTQINENANRVGAWVASQAGGMPTPERDLEHTLAEVGR